MLAMLVLREVPLSGSKSQAGSISLILRNGLMLYTDFHYQVEGALSQSLRPDASSYLFRPENIDFLWSPSFGESKPVIFDGNPLSQ